MYLISTTLPAAGGSCKIPASGIPAPAGRPRKPPPPRRVAPAPGLSAGTEKRSQFVRGSFDLFGRYVVSASLRRDGTDKFFPSKKYAFFPSVSLAWKMNEESFIKNISWINMLKLRASYGETGSDNLGTTLYGIVTTTREDVQFNNNSVQTHPGYME